MRIEKQRLNDKSAMIFTFEAVLDQEQVVEMARVVDAEMERPCTLHLLLDLRRTTAITAGAAISPKAFVTSVRSIRPVSRYAVVGAPEMAATAIEFFGSVLPLQAKAFADADYAAARHWIWSMDD